jgi:Icc-related predicted phosphoesterase
MEPQTYLFSLSGRHPLLHISVTGSVDSCMGRIPATKTRSKPRLTLVALSDTHELHRDLDVPDADILVHAGDFTLFSLFSGSSRSIADFDRWLGELPHRYKIVVPGNHEYILEQSTSPNTVLHNARVLINEGIQIEGLRFWGSPVTPLGSGAFGVASATDRRNLYHQIPGGTDVLITHSPPFGILDSAPGSDLHAGCPELLEAVRHVRPKLHLFGHIHPGYGSCTDNFTTYVNASLIGPYGALDKEPLLFRFKGA